jgi:hypothetical protein
MLIVQRKRTASSIKALGTKKKNKKYSSSLQELQAH